MTKEVKECGHCVFYEQGKNASFCGNPVQTNKDLKEYAYWNFGCELYKQGTAKSRIDYMEKLKV